jgi:hypothetical protein
MFHTHVASVLSGCCICFTHMLQVFNLDVAYVSHICCNSIFQMFHLCLIYVVSECFMLQVFHEGMASDVRMAQCRRTGTQRAGGRLLSPAHAEGERGGGPREGAGHSDGAGCACEAGAGCMAIHPDARSGGRRSPAVPTGAAPGWACEK